MHACSYTQQTLRQQDGTAWVVKTATFIFRTGLLVDSDDQEEEDGDDDDDEQDDDDDDND